MDRHRHQQSSSCLEQVPRDSLECQICCEIPPAEIYQCKNGHSFCVKCSTRLDKCPQCKADLAGGNTTVRNRALEELIGSSLISCKFRGEGCREISSGGRHLGVHQKTCEFRPIPLCQKLGIRCSYEGSSNGTKMFSHLQQVHKLIVFDSNAFEGSPRELCKELNLQCGLDVMHKKPAGVTVVAQYLVTLKSSRDLEAKFFFALPISDDAIVGLCLYLGETPADVSPFVVTIEMGAPDKDDKSWSGTGRPPHFKNVEAAMDLPPLTLSSKGLVKLFEKDRHPKFQGRIRFVEKEHKKSD